MACRSKRENSKRNPVRRVAWTIDELCASLCISRSLYEKAKRDGWGPREMALGNAGIRITEEACAEWIASREAHDHCVASAR